MHLFGLARGFGHVQEQEENMWKDYRVQFPAGLVVMFMRWVLADYGSGADCKDVGLVMNDGRMVRKDC